MLSERIRTWRYWPAVFGGLILLCAAYGFSSQHNTGHDNNYTAPQHADNKPHPETHEEITNDVIAHYTRWLALLTAALAGVGTIGIGISIIQIIYLGKTDRRAAEALYQASEQTKLARDEFVSTHRPKIRIKHLWLSGDISNGQQIAVDIGIVNTGTTEATLNQFGIRFVVVDANGQIPFDPFIPERPAGSQVLSTGVWMRIPDIYDGTALTGEQVAAIQAHRARLYCIGYVSYLDASHRMRITGFCRALTFPPNTLSEIANCRFRKYPDPDYEYED